MSFGGCFVDFFPILLLHILSFSRVKGDCLDPEVPKDGWRSSPDKHAFKTGEVIHYYCKANHTLNGSPKVRCLASGNWDTKPPKCIDPCGTCEHNGECVHQPSSRIYYCICITGFRGEKCEIAHCLPPKEVVHGGFHAFAPLGKHDYDIGTKLMFHCDKEYTIHGPNYDIECILNSDKTAKWSKSFPVCKARTCSNRMNNRMIPNGKYEPNRDEYKIDDIIKFSCNAGYELEGEAVLRCEYSGLWSSVNWPRCAAKKCLPPSGIKHGHVIQQSEDFPAGSIVSFACQTGDGYYRYGPKQQTCMANSNGDMIWVPPTAPRCLTKSVYEQYCVLQGKVMRLEPIPRCATRLHVDGSATTTTKRNASIDTLTIVTGTAGGLVGFLLVIIGFVIYQRRKLMRRMRRTTARRARSSEDQRMLIYCSNDFHFFLPTYDEAVRSRPAEPPPFDAVVDSGEQSQRTNPQGTTTDTHEGTSSTSLNPENIESEYESIDNIQASINAENATTQSDGVTQVASSSDTNERQNARTDSISSQESTADENEPLV